MRKSNSSQDDNFNPKDDAQGELNNSNSFVNLQSKQVYPTKWVYFFDHFTNQSYL